MAPQLDITVSEYGDETPAVSLAPAISDSEDSASLIVEKEQRRGTKALYPERFPYNPIYPKEGDFEVIFKEANTGCGVISYRSFKKGDVVAAMTGDVVEDIRLHTLQIKPGLHLHDVWFVGYLLHSCLPNVYLDMEQMLVYAVRDIEPNDHMYMDYAQTEDVLFRQFPCCCGATKCRGWITGRVQDPDTSDPLYQGHAAPVATKD